MDGILKSKKTMTILENVIMILEKASDKESVPWRHFPNAADRRSENGFGVIQAWNYTEQLIARAPK